MLNNRRLPCYGLASAQTSVGNSLPRMLPLPIIFLDLENTHSLDGHSLGMRCDAVHDVCNRY